VGLSAGADPVPGRRLTIAAGNPREPAPGRAACATIPPVHRALPLVLALTGSLLLAVAEFSRLYEIKVITVTVKTATVGSHHGYALLIVAITAAAMAWFAVQGGSRPAGYALLALSAVALVVVFAVDLPVVDDTGLYGRNYERAQAEAAGGFYIETLGAVLLLLGAVIATAFRVSRPATSRARGLGSPVEEGSRLGRRRRALWHRAREDRRDGQQQDLHVQAQRPVRDVVVVELDALGE
jgi:hypothetical protein